MDKVRWQIFKVTTYYVGLFFFIQCTLLFDGKERKKQRRWISAKQRLWQVASGNTGNQIHFLHLKIVYYYRLTEAYLRSHEYRCQNELQQLNLSRDYPKWRPFKCNVNRSDETTIDSVQRYLSNLGRRCCSRCCCYCHCCCCHCCWCCCSCCFCCCHCRCCCRWCCCYCRCCHRCCWCPFDWNSFKIIR